MKKYKVRSGQNIYDIALMLYGSVEGIFDLLANNKDINMETTLSYGMELNYNEDFVINSDISMWLSKNNILVKNGEHVNEFVDIKKFIQEHIKNHHPNIISFIESMSADEQNLYWETLYMPRMVMKHIGKLFQFNFQLISEKHLMIDWGDSSCIQIYEGDTEFDVDHCFDGDGSHTITLYGDFEFSKFDLSNLNGIYYPLGIIRANNFTTPIKIENINKLIVTL